MKYLREVRHTIFLLVSVVVLSACGSNQEESVTNETGEEVQVENESNKDTSPENEVVEDNEEEQNDDEELDNTEPLQSIALADRSGWILDASNNLDDLQNIVDTSLTTRWATQEFQNENQWLSIDLGATAHFNTIYLNSEQSLNDYPRGYNVYVSEDIEEWGSVIATGYGSSTGITKISFDAVSARYIKIEQTGSASQYWWSIYDLSLSLESDSETESPIDESVSIIQSLSELREAVLLDNQTIKLKAGNYSISELQESDRSFIISGDNNTIDLTDVSIDFPVNLTSEPHFLFLGSGNVLMNGTLQNSYPNGEVEITDYIAYNQDRDNLANGADVHMKITGDDNTVMGTTMTVRGSFPFGYGSLFGIGSTNSFGLSKRGGIQIGGKNTIIDGISLYLHAFGHGIYMQDPADNTTIRNTLVEGMVRETNEMLAEEEEDSLPSLNDYLDADGNPIPEDEMESLAEDGIRAYSGAGSVIVENSTVRKMRGGVRLYLASSAMVTDSIATDNGVTNFNMPASGSVINSSGNFTYSPLSDFRLSRSRQNIELTILPSPNAVGSHNIADIIGNNHDIVFHRADGPQDTEETKVIVVSGNNSAIRNETEYAMVLDVGTTGNTIVSAGKVTDNGNNSVTYIDLEL